MYETIPPDELETFREYIHVYPQGAQIIIEDQTDDMALFLLREGEVQVFKNIGSGRECIATIKAVNFFGEMSLIGHKPRSATVEACSRNVVVYAFQNPNLHTLLSNPRWGRMLVTRLCADLRDKTDDLAALRESSDNVCADLEEQINLAAALRASHDQLTRGVVEVLSILSELHKAIAADAVVTSREWHYLKAVEETVKRLVHARLPQIASRITPIGPLVWERLRRDDILPESLSKFIYRFEQESEAVE